MPFTDAALIKMNNADCVYTTEVLKAVYCSARSGFSECPMLGEKSEVINLGTNTYRHYPMKTGNINRKDVSSKGAALLNPELGPHV